MLFYPIVAGSIVFYGAYVHLLLTTWPAVATTYAYVNPPVAMLLGVTLGDQVIDGWAYVGLPVVLPGVALVGLARRRAGRDPARH